MKTMKKLKFALQLPFELVSFCNNLTTNGEGVSLQGISETGDVSISIKKGADFYELMFEGTNNFLYKQKSKKRSSEEVFQLLLSSVVSLDSTSTLKAEPSQAKSSPETIPPEDMAPMYEDNIENITSTDMDSCNQDKKHDHQFQAVVDNEDDHSNIEYADENSKSGSMINEQDCTEVGNIQSSPEVESSMKPGNVQATTFSKLFRCGCPSPGRNPDALTSCIHVILKHRDEPAYNAVIEYFHYLQLSGDTKKIKCIKCKKKFISDSKISLRRHILSYHTKEIDFGKMKNILSKSCEKTSSDMDTNKAEDGKLHCTVCKTYYSSYKAVYKHFQKVHKSDYGTLLDNVKTQMQNARVNGWCDNDIRVVCDDCGFKFKVGRGISHHIKLVHEENSKLAEQAELSKKYGPYYINHQMYYTCKLCNEKLSQPEILQHLNNTHQDEPTFTETLKFYTYRIHNYSKITKHVSRNSVYSNIKKICEFCSRAFSTANYIKHYKCCKNNPDRVRFYNCYCGYRTESEDKHKQHKDRCTNQTPQALCCEVCGKTCNSKATLCTHRRVTHQIGLAKPVEQLFCPVCKKAFWRRQTYEKHILTHAETKDYMCDACGKAFRTPSDLQKHSDTQHGDKFKYRCTKCGHGMEKEKYLKTHKCNRVRRKQNNLPSTGVTAELTTQPAKSEAKIKTVGSKKRPRQPSTKRAPKQEKQEIGPQPSKRMKSISPPVIMTLHQVPVNGSGLSLAQPNLPISITPILRRGNIRKHDHNELPPRGICKTENKMDFGGIKVQEVISNVKHDKEQTILPLVKDNINEDVNNSIIKQASLHTGINFRNVLQNTSNESTKTGILEPLQISQVGEGDVINTNTVSSVKGNGNSCNIVNIKTDENIQHVYLLPSSAFAAMSNPGNELSGKIIGNDRSGKLIPLILNPAGNQTVLSSVSSLPTQATQPCEIANHYQQPLFYTQALNINNAQSIPASSLESTSKQNTLIPSFEIVDINKLSSVQPVTVNNSKDMANDNSQQILLPVLQSNSASILDSSNSSNVVHNSQQAVSILPQILPTLNLSDIKLQDLQQLLNLASLPSDSEQSEQQLQNALNYLNHIRQVMNSSSNAAPNSGSSYDVKL